MPNASVVCAARLLAFLAICATSLLGQESVEVRMVADSALPALNPANPSSTVAEFRPGTPHLQPVALVGRVGPDQAAVDSEGPPSLKRGLGEPLALLAAPQTVLPPSGRGSVAHWWAPLASAVVPGTGQLALKQQRSAAYAVAEAYLILQYLGARRDGNRDRVAYRQLAVDVARRSFGGSFPTGPWEYYERMEHFQESGAYNLNSAGGSFEPETDDLTYNGSRWKAAREIYWRDPSTPPERNSAEYQSALTFYQQTAVSDEYLWSWRDASLEQTTYQNTISSANRSYQRAVNYAGVLVMNHLASLIDAYVSVRVRRFGGAGIVPIPVERVSLFYQPAASGPMAPMLGGSLAGNRDGYPTDIGAGQWHLHISVGLGRR